MNKHLCVALITVGLSSAIASGQTFSSVMQWQVSADAGQSWHNAVNVPNNQSSVLIRAWLSWEPRAAGAILAFTYFDATVRAVNGGFADTASMFATEQPSWRYSLPEGFAAVRFGEVLKVDDARDTEAPGIGARWIAPQQLSPNIDAFRFENPTNLFQYQLDLDGTLGLREASCVIRTFPARPTTPIGLWVPNTPFWTGEYSTVELRPATINVIPPPGPLALALSAAAMSVRRRSAAF